MMKIAGTIRISVTPIVLTTAAVVIPHFFAKRSYIGKKRTTRITAHASDARKGSKTRNAR